MQVFIILVLFFYSMLLSGCHAPSTESNIEMADTNIALAMNYFQQQQLDLVKEYLTRAKNTAPNYAVVWSSLAYYAEKIGDAAKADAYYQHAIQLAPHSGAIHNNYGVFLCHQKKYMMAIKQLMIAAQEPDYLNREMANRNIKICRLQRL